MSFVDYGLAEYETPGHYTVEDKFWLLMLSFRDSTEFAKTYYNEFKQKVIDYYNDVDYINKVLVDSQTPQYIIDFWYTTATNMRIDVTNKYLDIYAERIFLLLTELIFNHYLWPWPAEEIERQRQNNEIMPSYFKSIIINVVNLHTTLYLPIGLNFRTFCIGSYIVNRQKIVYTDVDESSPTFVDYTKSNPTDIADKTLQKILQNFPRYSPSNVIDFGTFTTDADKYKYMTFPLAVGRHNGADVTSETLSMRHSMPCVRHDLANITGLSPSKIMML